MRVCQLGNNTQLEQKGKVLVLIVSGDSKGGLGGPWPPRFLLSPPFGPPVFFLILRSFGWHMQGCQMRFVKIPAILSTAPDLSCVVIRKQHKENRETISIVKRQLMICPYFG